jgi:hypothetical protein
MIASGPSFTGEPMHTATKIPFYLFPEKELRRGLSPNFFHTHVCLLAIYICSYDSNSLVSPCTLQRKFIYSQKRNLAPPQSQFFPHLCMSVSDLYVFPRSQGGLRSLVSAHAHCNQNPIYLFPEKKLHGL